MMSVGIRPGQRWFSAASDPGLIRPKNEDAYLARPDRGLFAVADGMGGHQAGEVASALAIGALEAHEVDPANPAGALLAMVQEGHERILETASARPETRGMGTTLTVAHVGPERITVAHVGDSRAYVMKGGRLVQITRDHSVAAALVMSGEIDPAAARHHPQRHVLTQALGTQDTLDVDISEVDRAGADYLLLCTDGLVEVLTEEEIARTIGRGPGVEGAVAALVDGARRRGAPDNVTVILVDLRLQGGARGLGSGPAS